jgi:glycosyltransferase involved in cell wall biosynthesis
MIRKQKKGVFIVWKKFQRRVEVLAPFLDLEVHYFYYSWEEKSKILKALSYFLKSIDTFKCLFLKKPSLVFIQFPPAPALYCVALYSFLTGSRYVSDCHIGLTNANWLKWIHAKKLLIKGPMIVHNEHLIEQVIRSMNVKPFVVRDGIAKRQSVDIRKSSLLDDLGLPPKSYVIIPGSFSWDEPLREVIEAARMLPEIMFVLTWHFNRLSRTIRNNLPSNILLTGYLQIDDFNYLFANSGVALVLTKHEAVQLSGMQEAMAFEIPAVVTDLKTTRFLYKNYPVYVRNDPESIAYGVTYAFQNRHDLEEKIKKLRIETEREFFDQIVNLRTILNL